MGQKRINCTPIICSLPLLFPILISALSFSPFAHLFSSLTLLSIFASSFSFTPFASSRHAFLLSILFSHSIYLSCQPLSLHVYSNLNDLLTCLIRIVLFLVTFIFLSPCNLTLTRFPIPFAHVPSRIPCSPYLMHSPFPLSCLLPFPRALRPIPSTHPSPLLFSFPSPILHSFPSFLMHLRPLHSSLSLSFSVPFVFTMLPLPFLR